MKGNFAIELGKEVVDVVTQFKGFVTGRVECLTGCRQYLIQPAVDGEGKFVENRWFDEDRLAVADFGKHINLETKNAGPDAPAPAK